MTVFGQSVGLLQVFRKCFILDDSYNNNNNQAFYSQASWGRLEMKPHESKKQVQNKSKKEGKTKCDKKPNQKEKRQ
jgi:hypothetical protein